jgi:glutamate synthase (NADPH/NADH) small chain
MGSATPSPDRLEKSFHDKKPLLSDTEASLEAARCLYCFDAPCIKACPTSIDIPTFIRKIATGNLRGAARTILSANLLGASCARVCPVEVLCEGDCVYNQDGRPPISIGRLQRYATIHGRPSELLEKAAPTGRSVGLVGAGPASLACAGTLALLGHAPVIYEKNTLPGGLNATGVAPYKLFLEDALEEVAAIVELGVEIRTGVTIGRDVIAEELLERHDAVFLGSGLGPDSHLGVPGEEGRGVEGAVHWIEEMKTRTGLSLDGVRNAVVVGGGNTAVDAVRELLGLGVPSVTMIYRRGASEMKAYAHELALAKTAGAIVVEKAIVKEIVRRSGKVVSVRLSAAKNGRATDEARGELPADLVLVATGQSRLRELATSFPGVACDEKGRIVADPATCVTGNPRVFAGGDAMNGGMEVVNAVHEGQLAARSIDLLLRAGKIAESGDDPRGARTRASSARGSAPQLASAPSLAPVPKTSSGGTAAEPSLPRGRHG